MKSGAPNVSVWGFGRHGAGFVPEAWADTAKGIYDPERVGHPELRLSNRNGSHDVSPKPHQVAAASAGKTRNDAQKQVFADMVTRGVQAIVLEKAVDGVLVVAHDDEEIVMGPVRAARAQLPQLRIAGQVPWDSDGDPGHGNCSALPLRAELAPFAVGHYGSRSPFAVACSPQRQDVFVVATHNALCLAPLCHPANPTIGVVYERLGAWGPCFQYGFSSLPLAIGKRHGVAAALKGLVGGSFTPAYGDLDNALKVAARATLLAREPAALTTTVPFDPDRPHYVVYLVPFHPRSRAFREFTERQSVALAKVAPAAEGMFVSGPGVPPLDGEGERFLQVSILAPLRVEADERGDASAGAGEAEGLTTGRTRSRKVVGA